MTNEFLKTNGKLISEVDFNNNGVYAGTRYFYLYENTLYCRYKPTNGFQYDGKTETYIAVTDVRNTLKDYNSEYFVYEIGIDEDGYEKLKEIIYGKELEEINYDVIIEHLQEMGKVAVEGDSDMIKAELLKRGYDTHFKSTDREYLVLDKKEGV